MDKMYNELNYVSSMSNMKFDQGYVFNNVQKGDKFYEKSSKGLRHFSTKVCEKVQNKGTTTYNEVADELVRDFSKTCFDKDQKYDQKNIRRRVYDALNVLMAMNIITKHKKEIKWIGLPSETLDENRILENERDQLLQNVAKKSKLLYESILQTVAIKNLVKRNKSLEESGADISINNLIRLPFIVISTNNQTMIDCHISSNKDEYLFNFDSSFQITDDMQILSLMGLLSGLDQAKVHQSDLIELRKLVPNDIQQYVNAMSTRDLNQFIEYITSQRLFIYLIQSLF